MKDLFNTNKKNVKKESLELDVQSELFNFDCVEEDHYQIIDDNCGDVYEVVDISKLEKHSNNSKIFLEIEDQVAHENLKSSILERGLIHPIVCKRSKKGYVIISGHRRHQALSALVKDGHFQFSSTRIKVVSFDSEMAEMEYILDANITNREISDYSKMMSVYEYSHIYDYKKKNRQLPSGLSQQVFVADKMKMGTRQVAKYLFIINNLEKELITEVLKNDEMSLNKLYIRIKELGIKDTEASCGLSNIVNEPSNEPPVELVDQQQDIEAKPLNAKTRRHVERLVKDLVKINETSKSILDSSELDKTVKKRIISLINNIEKTNAVISDLIQVVE